MQFVGLDVGKRNCYATVLEEDGSKVCEKKFPAVPSALKSFASSIAGSKAVVEASLNYLFAFDVLEENGVEVCVANPLKVKAIASARIKTDAIDSNTLAHLLRTDMVPESWVPKKETRDLRSLVRHRAMLVNLRSKVKNRVNSLLAKEWIVPEYNDLFGRKGREFLDKLELKPMDKLVLDDCLETISFLDKQIEEVSTKVKEVAENNEEAMLLTSIPGISYYSALLIVSEIGDINRFENEKKLASYAGLVPRLHQSGGTLRMGHITKEGSNWLRWIMTQVAYASIRGSERMKRRFIKIAERRGKKIAVMGVARELLNIIFFMLKRKEVYRENYA